VAGRLAYCVPVAESDASTPEQRHLGLTDQARAIHAHHLAPADGDVNPLPALSVDWAQSLLEVNRYEVARADDKANTLFRFYGVVAALSVGLLAGKGWSPAQLAPLPQVLFWLGCAALLASGWYLGITLYPRNVRVGNPDRLLYFGDVTRYRSAPELADALRDVPEDRDLRVVQQLLVVCRLVERKFGYMRRALQLLAVGTTLCLAAVLLDAASKRL